MPKKPIPATNSDESQVLKIKEEPGQANSALLAKSALNGIAGNAITAMLFSQGTFGKSDVMGCVDAVRESALKVNRGDLEEIESTLVAQSISLDKIFQELARRAALNMGEHLDATECYVRLALKAQSQCRATLESLANIKNPPILYARQANISHGPQQVNNGNGPQNAHAGENQVLQNGLLEAQHENTLDYRTAGQAGAANSTVATLGASHRPTNARRQDKGGA